MTRYIVRLRPWWLRVPLWSLWYFIPAGRVLLSALWSYPHRLVTSEFWMFMWAGYLIGIDGL